MAEIFDKVPTPEEFIELKKKLEEVKEEITKVKAEITGAKTRFSDSNDDGTAHSNEDDSHDSIGSYISQIKRYEELIVELTDISKKLTDISKYCADNIQYVAAQYIIKEVQETALEVKSILLNLKVKVSKQTKEILTAVTAWKGAAVTSAVVMPIIAQFQAISATLTTALTAIDSVINMLPDLLSVGAESMAFFMTPKSLKKTDIIAINTNMSIGDRLPEPVKVAVRTGMKSLDKINIPIKTASIAACGAAGMAAAKQDNNDFTIPGCKSLNLLDPKKLTNTIELIVSLLPIPQGLPKYERLSITNLGFDAWLMTSFCKSGKQSFGFPFQP